MADSALLENGPARNNYPPHRKSKPHRVHRSDAFTSLCVMSGTWPVPPPSLWQLLRVAITWA